MQYAINYSPEATALFHEGQIAPDYFKCPDWPDLIAEARQHRPVYIHFPLQAGAPAPLEADWDTLTALRDDTHTPTVNVHLSARRADYPHIPFDSTDPAHLAEITDALLRDVQLLVDRFGADNVIVENIPYYAADGKLLRAAAEPSVIRQVVAETGCGFLLDISHGLMAAHYMGVDGRAYLRDLPVHRLRELHVTGIHEMDGRLRDHLSMLPPGLGQPGLGAGPDRGG
jgi:uncharacterized protein (UPF0276 family)